MSFEMSSYRKWLLVIVFFSWLTIFLISDEKLHLFSDYSYFFLLGLFGAIVANSTGAGGGIIFIPFFTALGMAGSETLGTSILIQCFGMTAGTISWLTTSHIVKTNSLHLNRLIVQLLIICGSASIIGVLFGQYFLVLEDPTLLLIVFRVFSVVFGLVLIGIVFFSHKQVHTHFDLSKNDIVLLAFVGFTGGLITAWISVGVGEVIAIVLILRRYPTMVAISMGVAMSAVSVLTAAYHHIYIIESVNWSVIMFAVPGAILGGTFAYMLSEQLGPMRLKVFFSVWIIITGFLI